MYKFKKGDRVHHVNLPDVPLIYIQEISDRYSDVKDLEGKTFCYITKNLWLVKAKVSINHLPEWF